MRILTQTELATWLRCRRKWFLSHYRQLRHKRYGGSPLTIGSLVHYGLEAYYRPGGARRHPLETIQQRAQEMLDRYPEDTNDILKCAELAAIMLEGYLEWLEAEGADADLEITGAEEAVEVQLGPTYRLRGKLDARGYRRSDGLLLQLEDKTVANLVDLPKVAQTNFQYLTYDLLAFLAAREYAVRASETVLKTKPTDEPSPSASGQAEPNPEPPIQRTDGVLLNMLRKVKRTATAKPPFYGRHEVRHNQEELRSHWRHVLAIAQETDRARERLDAGENHHVVAPPTPARDCSYACEFYAVCGPGMFDDGSDFEGMLASAYEIHDPLERYAEDLGE